MGRGSFSSFKYWQQLYLLSFLWKFPFSYPKRGNCKVVRFSVARPSCFPLSGRGKKCKNRRNLKKWGSRFASYLSNETRYDSQISIWCSSIVQLPKSIEFVAIGPQLIEKFWFEVRQRKKEIRANRDFFSQVVNLPAFIIYHSIHRFRQTRAHLTPE